jgi:hydroxypyruvate isomerase
VKQGIAWWSINDGHDDSDATLLHIAKKLGYDGVDFLPPALWPTARELGLELSIVDGHLPLESGFNDRADHARLSDELRRNLEIACANEITALSVMGGDDIGLSDDDAIAACVEGLSPLAAEAEQAGVLLLLEPLNTKVDHPGHQCASTAWAAAVVNGVDSPALRILYDVYHMQIMEGDLLRTLESHLPLIGHIHTAGVPGRHELGDEQEVNWTAIARFLARAEFLGYVTHEYLPTSDVEEGLARAHRTFANIER